MIPPALWLIQRQLKSRSLPGRLRAVQKLRAQSHAVAFDLLLGALNDSESEVRREAASAMAEWREERAVRALMNAARDPVEPVQEAAILALEKHGDPLATDTLVAALLGPGGHTVRWRAAHALKALNWRPKSNAEEIRYLVALGELERMVAFGEAAVSAVAGVLADSPYERRVAAVNVLGEIGGSAVMKPLQNALHDSDALVRTAAAYALARVNNPQVVPSLIHGLKDNDRNVRVAVALGLGKLGDARAVEPLIRSLDDREWEVRAAALESLGRLGDARAFQPVAEHLDDRDQEVRQYAADAVAQVGDESIVEKLVMTLVDANTGVRQAAARALNKLDPYWDRSERVQRLLPAIQSAATSKDAGVQFAVASLLKRISGRSAVAATLPTAGSEVERAPLTTTAVLQDLLRDRDAEVRLAAVECIARLGGTTFTEALEAASGDADLWVRAAAQRALQMSDKPAATR